MITSEVMVVMKENWPRTTSTMPGRRKSRSSDSVSSAPLAMVLASSRMEMPRITPGITSGTPS
jgi:hypothetical protein